MARLPQRVSSVKRKALSAQTKPQPVPIAPVTEESASEDEDADIPLDESSDSEAESNQHEGASEDSEEDEDEGVDEAGLKRLMSALGDDGLDEFELAQLGSLQGGDTEDDEDSEDAEAEGDSEDGSQSGIEEEDDQAEAALSDESSDEEDEEGSTLGEAGPSRLPLEDEDEDIALDEVDYVDDDAVPRQKIEVDNTITLRRIRENIQLAPSMSWTETLVVTYPEKIEVDAEDDLTREVAFYKQALHSAQAAKSLAAKHNLPFSRPADYFAEMVKSDSHMERIRQRLLDEKAGIVRGEQKRREREGKKFGKQVQLEKQRERERSKKDMEERLKGLKRKRKGALDNAEADEGDKFDVAVEEAIADRPAKRGRSDSARGRGGQTRMPRSARDSKFGFGSGSKRSKQNTKSSTDDFDAPSRRGSGQGGRGGSSRGRGGRGGGSGSRGGSKRLGKSRRMSQK